METISIQLPSSLKQFLDEQVATAGSMNASEYIQRLIAEDQNRKAHEDIDRQLLEAIDSGSSTPLTDQDWDDIRREVQERSARRMPSETLRPAIVVAI